MSIKDFVRNIFSNTKLKRHSLYEFQFELPARVSVTHFTTTMLSHTHTHTHKCNSCSGWTHYGSLRYTHDHDIDVSDNDHDEMMLVTVTTIKMMTTTPVTTMIDKDDDRQ